ncbi:CRISPR-associated endonuclease Cas1 [Microbacterium suaedae]|uniref:CRISPR-associated endonuclease Cas1 n=1 Tax=Microbacterium suaedae TaxID=2067813 RepID=UPI0013A6507D|nr:CRISPR-associated endonuclease Cas1 [Microbacterium suaedae]
MRRAYRDNAERTGVKWTRRDYNVDDVEGSDLVNQALSAANTSLYGVVHSVLVALGCAPGLGFVHTGHTRSFVYDVADLYKADLTIPLAFDLAAQQPFDIAAEARRALRDRLHGGGFLDRCVRDVRHLLLPDEEEADPSENIVELWDGSRGSVSGGSNYGEAS